VPTLPPGPTGGGELPNPLPSNTTTTDRNTNTLPCRTTFLQDGKPNEAAGSLTPLKRTVNRVSLWTNEAAHFTSSR
jgi:hypothetical protein